MKLKNIKFENIFFIIMLMYGAIAIQQHLYNGLSFLEIPTYLGQAILVRYTVKYIRVNSKAFIKEINDLISDK